MSHITQSLDLSTDLSPTASLWASLPDHTQLPDSDGNFVFAKRAEGKNIQNLQKVTSLLTVLHQFCSNCTLMVSIASVEIVGFTGA
jgi:hypothetical protein